MPPQSPKDTEPANPVVQMPPEALERLVLAIERMAASQTAESVAELRTAWLTQVNEANARLQTDTLAAIAERLNQPYQPARPITGQLSIEQRQAALSYDAFRTALGRPGAASIVMGERSGGTIIITAGHLPDTSLTPVVYAANGREIGRGHVRRADYAPQGQIRGLENDDVVAWFEVREAPDDPIRWGTLVTSIHQPVRRR